MNRETSNIQGMDDAMNYAFGRDGIKTLVYLDNTPDKATVISGDTHPLRGGEI